jgi:hypothetical protein
MIRTSGSRNACTSVVRQEQVCELMPICKRLKKDEARDSLPEELRPMFDMLCEETLAWSQAYYGTSLISYSIIKELVESGWTKIPR